MESGIAAAEERETVRRARVECGLPQQKPIQNHPNQGEKYT